MVSGFVFFGEGWVFLVSGEEGCFFLGGEGVWEVWEEGEGVWGEGRVEGGEGGRSVFFFGEEGRGLGGWGLVGVWGFGWVLRGCFLGEGGRRVGCCFGREGVGVLFFLGEGRREGAQYTHPMSFSLSASLFFLVPFAFLFVPWRFLSRNQGFGEGGGWEGGGGGSGRFSLVCVASFRSPVLACVVS